MAKQGKGVPARKSRADESLLLRSAESLGKMIGSLQRELDDAAKKLLQRGAPKGRAPSGNGNGKARPNGARTSAKTSAAADGKSKPASKSAVGKAAPPTGRANTKTRARKAARHA